ncbi:alpha/beta hydrolase [Roseibium sp. M-1]
MTDYAHLLDEDVAAFVERVNAFYPPRSLALPVEENRRIYDRMCADCRAPRPAHVVSVDRIATHAGVEVPVRCYRSGRREASARPVALYFHGGGFILGDLDSHDDICAEICAGTSLDVISVDYRLAPEHRHPAPFEDAATVFAWVRQAEGRDVLLIGESAGGNLAACLAHSIGADRGLIGQVLIYPALSGPCPGDSFRRHAHAPLLAAEDIAVYDRLRWSGPEDREDIRFTPFAAETFTNIPPTSLFAAEYDPLTSEGEAYCNLISQSGGCARFFEETGLIHGYCRARKVSFRAGEAFKRILAEVDRLAGS